jgi:hypothetical protein
MGPVLVHATLFVYMLHIAPLMQKLSGTIKWMLTVSGLRTRLPLKFTLAGALRRNSMDPAFKCVNRGFADLSSGCLEPHSFPWVY